MSEAGQTKIGNDAFNDLMYLSRSLFGHCGDNSLFAVGHLINVPDDQQYEWRVNPDVLAKLRITDFAYDIDSIMYIGKDVMVAIGICTGGYPVRTLRGERTLNRVMYGIWENMCDGNMALKHVSLNRSEAIAEAVKRLVLTEAKTYC